MLVRSPDAREADRGGGEAVGRDRRAQITGDPARRRRRMVGLLSCWISRPLVDARLVPGPFVRTPRASLGASGPNAGFSDSHLGIRSTPCRRFLLWRAEMLAVRSAIRPDNRSRSDNRPATCRIRRSRRRGTADGEQIMIRSSSSGSPRGRDHYSRSANTLARDCLASLAGETRRRVE